MLLGPANQRPPFSANDIRVHGLIPAAARGSEGKVIRRPWTPPVGCQTVGQPLPARAPQPTLEVNFESEGLQNRMVKTMKVAGLVLAAAALFSGNGSAGPFVAAETPDAVIEE